MGTERGTRTSATMVPSSADSEGPSSPAAWRLAAGSPPPPPPKRFFPFPHILICDFRERSNRFPIPAFQVPRLRGGREVDWGGGPLEAWKWMKQPKVWAQRKWMWQKKKRGIVMRVHHVSQKMFQPKFFLKGSYLSFKPFQSRFVRISFNFQADMRTCCKSASARVSRETNCGWRN